MCFSVRSPVVFDTAGTTVWSRRKIQWSSDPCFFFRFLKLCQKNIPDFKRYCVTILQIHYSIWTIDFRLLDYKIWIFEDIHAITFKPWLSLTLGISQQQLGYILKAFGRLKQVQIIFSKSKDSRVKQKIPPFRDSTINEDGRHSVSFEFVFLKSVQSNPSSQTIQ